MQEKYIEYKKESKDLCRRMILDGPIFIASTVQLGSCLRIAVPADESHTVASKLSWRVALKGVMLAWLHFLNEAFNRYFIPCIETFPLLPHRVRADL